MKNNADSMPNSTAKSSSISGQTPTLSTWQVALASAVAGGLFAFVGISLSMEMTHTSLAELNRAELGIAIAMPFLFGAIALKFKQPFLNALEIVMNSLPY